MELTGVTGAPYKHPKVQRKLPAPFQRPSINAGGAPVKRVWQQVKVLDLTEGDTVAGFGVIAEISEIRTFDRAYYVVLTNVAGESWRYTVADVVFAFHPEDHPAE